MVSFGMKVKTRKIPLGELAKNMYAKGSRGFRDSRSGNNEYFFTI
jgi:hypothetical protein